MIEFSDDKFYLAYWFVDQPSKVCRQESGIRNNNWIACLWQNLDGTYKVRYRFAYYDEEENHVESHWFGGTARPDARSEEVTANIDFLAEITATRNGHSKWERVDLNARGEAAIKKLLTKPWFHIKGVIPANELN